MKRPVFAANWKMNVGPSDAKAFMRTFLANYPRRPDRTVIFFPSALALPAVADTLRERPDLMLGVQNIHWEDKGAFTGENAASIARDAGARLALVGHSERRHVFGETNEQTAKKCAAAVRAGLTPLLCVGETLAEREHGTTERVVVEQLRAGVAALQPAQIGTMLIAYEPVWAIGTGRNATPDDAASIHKTIRATLKELVPDRAAHIAILYGGSVNRENARALIASSDVDGLLVGGASLDPEGWSSIART